MEPAVYRGPRDDKGAAAWCEEHVEREGADDQPRQGAVRIVEAKP